MEQELLTYDEVKSLCRRTDVLQGYGDAGNVRTILWQRKSEMPDGPGYTNPTSNFNGVSVWCILDGDVNVLRRIHVCAYDPCRARHVDSRGNVAVSKYGIPGPPEDHVKIDPPRLAHLAPPDPSSSGAMVSAAPQSPPNDLSQLALLAVGPSFRPMTPDGFCDAALTPPGIDVPMSSSSGHSTPCSVVTEDHFSVVAEEPMHIMDSAALAPAPPLP